MMAVGEAERTVADARMADLKVAQDAARRCHVAAKGLVIRARKDGSAEKIAAAVGRERQAYAESMAVSDAAIDEMFVINRAGLDRLTDLLGQMGPAWGCRGPQTGGGAVTTPPPPSRVRRSHGRDLGRASRACVLAAHLSGHHVMINGLGFLPTTVLARDPPVRAHRGSRGGCVEY